MTHSTTSSLFPLFKNAPTTETPIATTRQVKTIPLLKFLALAMIRSTDKLVILRTTRVTETSLLLEVVLCLLLALATYKSLNEAASIR
jgi:hypothetical protein